MRGLLITSCVAVFALPALAQEDLIEQDQIKQETEEREGPKEGWNLQLVLGFNGAYTHNSGVVGNPDGSNVQLGGVLTGEANLKAGQHEWLNKLNLQHMQTLTPQLDEFIKTTDNLELRSMYLYSLESVPWLGPFARARLQTSILAGELIRPDTVTLRRTSADGTTEDEVLEARSAEQLTSAFEPVLLRQSAGVFARPWRGDKFKLTTTLGAGAQEILSQGGFAVSGDEFTEDADGDPDTPETVTVVPLSEIQTSVQIGAEFEALAEGLINEQVTWSLFVNLLMPFYTNQTILDAEGQELEGFDLLNTELGGKLSVKLAKWASIDYVISAKRLPVVVDEWQVQNSVLLSSAFNLL